jgi:hypothetical protein
LPHVAPGEDKVVNVFNELRSGGRKNKGYDNKIKQINIWQYVNIQKSLE